MTKPVKPLISTTSKSQPKPAAKPAQPQIVKIGNVQFDKTQIDLDETKTSVKNGKKINSVMVKPGVRIEYPDQDAKQGASVKSTGLSEKWYNHDDSYIHINNLNNATIYGAKNKTDFIDLEGKSSNNKVIVNQKESLWIDRSQRQDFVSLGVDTKNNKVYMDEKDKVEIFYNNGRLIPKLGKDSYVFHGEEVLFVEGGAGICPQEQQLKNELGDNKYQAHKHMQQDK